MTAQPVEPDAFDDLSDIELGEDIDEVAVERRCEGDRGVTLNAPETARAFEILSARGLSHKAIADTVGCSPPTVARWAAGHSPTGLASSRPPAAGEVTILDRARTHDLPQIRRLAGRIDALFAELQRALDDDIEKAKVRAEVDRLERELIAARARLRTSPPPSKSPTELLTCRKGCGKQCKGGTGRASHERVCDGIR